MGKTKNKFKKTIELFHEKTGDVVRTIKFKNQKEFDDFLYGYRSMRYPGYKWRFLHKKKRENKTNDVKT